MKSLTIPRSPSVQIRHIPRELVRMARMYDRGTVTLRYRLYEPEPRDELDILTDLASRAVAQRGYAEELYRRIERRNWEAVA